jgi:hypothetical protein
LSHPVAAGDHRDVRKIQVACGEQQHLEEEEDPETGEGEAQTGSVFFSSSTLRCLRLLVLLSFVDTRPSPQLCPVGPYLIYSWPNTYPCAGVTLPPPGNIACPQAMACSCLLLQSMLAVPGLDSPFQIKALCHEHQDPTVVGEFCKPQQSVVCLLQANLAIVLCNADSLL